MIDQQDKNKTLFEVEGATTITTTAPASLTTTTTTMTTRSS
jgi:hypothetical protein